LQRIVFKIEVALEPAIPSCLVATCDCSKCGHVISQVDLELFPEVTPQILIGRVMAIHGPHIFPNRTVPAGKTKSE